MQVKQKEAIYNIVTTILKENGKTVEPDVPVKLTSEEAKDAVAMITHGFESGTIALSDKARQSYDSEKKIRNYASSLLNNNLSKDKRLNGNRKHQYKNPGSKAGAGDQIIKDLREYKKMCTAPEDIQKANAAIARRLEEIRQENLEKMKSKIDMSTVNSYLQKCKQDAE